MKHLLLIALLAIITPVLGQDCLDYYPTEVGEKFTVKTFNKKDKLESYAKYKVKDASAEKITYHAQYFDEDDEKLHDVTFDILCDNGRIKVDMKSMMSMDMLQKMQSEGMEMEIESDYVEFPVGQLSVGQSLPDANMSIEMKMEGMGTMMTMKSHMYDRKVEGMEDVEIEGKTYKCYKITGTTDVDMGFISSTTKSATYISKDAGYVKSESYNKRGKLESYTIILRE
jgi:hypothetical protein